MIQYRFEEEREFALKHAKALSHARAIAIIQSGVLSSSEDTKALADFYWAMVDATVGDNASDTEQWLERLYSSFHIAASNAGFSDAWDDSIPE
ncbi:hypothetical protein [Endozoicomonas arenosclerae]|uniref:hypothetical protein n=1 Tax=Endozoicomonas arenosclerae TaxID=1633495 RepID=UPI000781A53C|nr:hypothetical protein [Endozoicomonas arenosclerae]